MSAIGVGSGGDESFGLDAPLSWDGIEADEIERDVFEDGKIVCAWPERARI
ncbi:hypothetical protein FACS189488_02730 [Betaproteobacteria bacterium]|nr:hypothetical protein FACS189488_02730 [Betaproteobacteria bacterium]